jgi:hypothetical protein
LEKVCIGAEEREGKCFWGRKVEEKQCPTVSIGPAPSGSTGIEGIEGITPAFSYTDMAEY